jgi:hypothetical protein
VFDKSKFNTVPVDQWINEWMERQPSPEFRGCMVLQLYTIRKKHGRDACKEYRNYMKSTGHYPTQKQR